MKKSFILFLFILLNTLGYGQFKTIAEGPEFKEPGRGQGKIFLLKKGNTAFIQIFTDDDDIAFQLYGSDHKQKFEKIIKPAYEKDKLKDVASLGMFEYNGKITFFVSASDKNAPVLIRLIIDANTGVLEKEEKIGELAKTIDKKEYEHTPKPQFYFKKDDNSNNYAIVFMNSFEPDLNKRIEIIFYSADNKEIARSYYNSPQAKYKYMQYLDMTVIGDEKVEILVRAGNMEKLWGKDVAQELVLAELAKGTSKVALTELSSIDMSSSDNRNNDEFHIGLMTYNPATKRLLLIVSRENVHDEHHTYTNSLINFDLEKKKIEKTVALTMDKVNEKNIELFGKNRPYSGAPLHIYVNADGSYSIIYEAIRRNSVTTGNITRTFHVASNIAISNYDKTDQQTGSALIPSDYYLYEYFVYPFSILNRITDTYTAVFRDTYTPVFGNRDDFKFFSYVHAKDKSYILVNDIAKNADNILRGDITTIRTVAACESFYYNINDTGILLKRNFTFGQPERKEHYMHLPGMASYDEENNVYVTLKLNMDSKKYKLVWMQL